VSGADAVLPYGLDMDRWGELFADLEAQADVLEQQERAAEVDERVRAEVGATALIDRLRVAVGSAVRVRLDGLLLAGELAGVGPDWILLNEPGGQEAVVPLAAVLGIDGPGRLAAVPGTMDRLQSRLGLRHVLRRIARDRSIVRLAFRDQSTLAATIDRVGEDFVEVAVHPPGEARRVRSVQEIRLIPYSALVAVRRGP
jgi:hypothetical protein